MATRSKARKSASRKTRNGDSYKGIPADKRKEVALTVRLIRAAGQRTTPGKVCLQIAQQEAAQAGKLAREKKEWAEEIRSDALKALPAALDKFAEARDVAGAIENDQEGVYFDHKTLARLIRLDVDEAGRELEQALCNLGLIKSTDNGHFIEYLRRQGENKAKAAQPAQGVAHA